MCVFFVKSTNITILENIKKTLVRNNIVILLLPTHVLEVINLLVKA
jgi:hypothetical protein